MASPRVEKILRQVFDTAANLVDLDSFYAALLSETTGQLEFPFAFSNGKELKTGKGKWAPRLYKGRAVLPDYVMETGRPVLAEPDLKSWMAENKVAYRKEIPLSWLGVPMVVGTKVLGALVAENYGKVRAFDSGTLTVLSSIASRAATAIVNARLYERLERLNEVGQRLTSGIRLQRDEILKLIYEQASHLMDTRNMYVALYDEKADMVSFGLAMQDGQPVDVEKEKGWAPRKAGKGRTEEIIRTQDPILHKTKEEAEEWYAKHEEYIGEIASSWLGVPMMVGEKVPGVIAIYNWERENVYDKDDLEVLQTMANQAAIAIDNAVLYYDINQNLERRIRDLQVLNEVGQQLTSGILLRKDEILELICEQASRLMDTRNMYIALYDEETEMVSFGLAMIDGRRVDVREERGWQPRKAGEGATEEVIRISKPLFLRTRREAEEWYAKHVEYIGLVPSTWLGVPMIAREKVLGVIALHNLEQDHAYGQDDLDVLQTMAGQAAIAMENSRLFGQEQKRADEMAFVNEVGRLLSATLDVDKIPQLFVGEAIKTLNAETGSLALVDEKAGEVVFQFALDNEEMSGYRLPISEGIIGRVARTGMAAIVDDVRQDPDWYGNLDEITEFDTKSILAVPLKYGNRVTGVIEILNKREGSFTESEKEWLTALAASAAIAIENAGLYEQLERRYIELETEYIAREQLAALGTATAALQHRVSNTLNLVNPGIMRLRSRIDPDDKDAAEILDIMERNVGYTSQIISRLQEPLKEEDATVTDVNSRLKEIVLDMEEREPDVCQGVSFDLDGLSPAIPRIEIGTRQLTEVLRNLVENACKAMQPQGGTLTLSSRLVGSTIELEFRDTGPGIPPNVLERLFIRPVPPKDFGAGTGLGLWLSKLILQKYGGDIEVKETSDKGTIMLVLLPTMQKQQLNQQAESEEVP